MNYDDVDVPAESRQVWDAIRAGDVQTVERWLDTGVDPSALLVPGNDTTTPLFLALAPGGMMHDEPTQLDVMRLLLSRGADINCSFTLELMQELGGDEMRQLNLLTVAIGFRRDTEAILLLMELGVDLDDPVGISSAFYSGPDVLKILLRGGALLDGPAWPPMLRMSPEELGELLGVHEDLISGAAATAMSDITGEAVDSETVGEVYADSRLASMRSARFLVDVRAAGGWKRVRSAEFLRSYATAVNRTQIVLRTGATHSATTRKCWYCGSSVTAAARWSARGRRRSSRASSRPRRPAVPSTRSAEPAARGPSRSPGRRSPLLCSSTSSSSGWVRRITRGSSASASRSSQRVTTYPCQNATSAPQSDGSAATSWTPKHRGRGCFSPSRKKSAGGRSQPAHVPANRFCNE